MSLSAQDTRSGVKGVAFSPDGRRVMTTDELMTAVNVWDTDLAGDEEVATLPAVKLFGGSAASASDDRRLMATAPDGAVAVWDPDSRRGLRTFGPDGSSTGSAGSAASVDDWPSHRGIVTSVAFSPDGSRLASVSGDGTIRIWTLDLDDLVDIARNELTRTLTDEECRRYLHQARCPR